MKICKICNKSFKPTKGHPHQKYCSSFCYLEAGKANTARWIKKHPDQYKTAVARWHKNNPEKVTANTARWAKNNPEKVAAQEAVHYAVKTGKLTKLPCQVCNNLKSEAHHYLGYAEMYWLHVIWVCRLHHKAAERVLNTLKTIPELLKALKASKEETLV